MIFSVLVLLSFIELVIEKKRNQAELWVLL